MLNTMWQQIARTEQALATPSSIDANHAMYIKVGHVEFDDQSREVLEILADLNSQGYFSRKAPENYFTASQIERYLGISHSLLLKVVDELGIDPKSYLHRETGNLLAHYTPEEIELIVNHPSLDIPTAGKNDMTLRQIHLHLGVSPDVIKRIIALEAIEPQFRRSVSGRPRAYFMPSQIQRIARIVQSRQRAPEGYVKVHDAASSIGLGDETLAKQARLAGFALKVYLNERGQPERFVSHDAIAALTAIEQQFTEMPPDAVSLPQVRELTDLAGSSIRKICNELNIEPKLARNQQNMPFAYMDAEQFARFSLHPLVNTLPAPANFRTRTGIAADLGVSETAVRSATKKLGLVPTSYRHPRIGRITNFYSPKQIKQIQAHLSL